MRILLAGCNHKTAPLAVRERIAFDSDSAARALAALRASFGQVEGLLLSTCNRVELYVARPAHRPPSAEQLVEFIAGCHRLTASGEPGLAGAFYQHADRPAVEHLFRVAASLDSMVLGETQILGQVREAFELAQQAGATGPVLSRLCTEAISAARRVHKETGLSAGRVSVASVACQFARKVFPDSAGRTVLVVGAGKMAEQTLTRLMELCPADVLVANRSRGRAEELAGKLGGAVLDLGELPAGLARADIVITSTGSPAPLVTARMMAEVMASRPGRPIFIIDIAVPRDVSPEVGRLDRVHLYNIDDLQEVVESSLAGRADRLADAQAILRQHADQFLAWLRARPVQPTIAALCRRLADLRTEELAWLMPKLAGATDRDRELIEQFAHRLISKVLHDPVEALAAACESEGSAGDVYAQTIARLFNLTVEEDGPPPTDRGAT